MFGFLEKDDDVADFDFLGIITIVTVSLIGAAIAEELPSELLLKCDLKKTGYSVYQGRPDYHEMLLSKTFRLKDRVFSLVDSRLPSSVRIRRWTPPFVVSS